MSEDMTGAPAQQDTPEPTDVVEGAPAEGGHGAESVDWEKRYNDLRPQFDKTNQELAEARQYAEAWQTLNDPETRDDALRMLGIEVEDDTEDDFDDDPLSHLSSEVETLKETLARQAQEQQTRAHQEQVYSHLEESLASLEAETQDELTDDEIEVVFRLADTMRDTNGMPDVKAAYERIFNTVLEGRRSRWVESKKGAAKPPTGRSATEQPDLDNPRERDDIMARRLEALSAD